MSFDIEGVVFFISTVSEDDFGGLLSVGQESADLRMHEATIVNLDCDPENGASNDLSREVMWLEHIKSHACLSFDISFANVEEFDIICIWYLEGTMTTAHHV